MVEYIKQIVRDLLKCSEGKAHEAAMGLSPLCKSLAEELNGLDPRDFLPDAQYDFVRLRMWARWFAGLQRFNFDAKETSNFQYHCKSLITLLDKYGGDGSRAVSRDFSFVTDADLRGIIERDYRELSLRLFPSEAWKSVVIMAGSILEAILYDALTKDAITLARAKASPKASSADITKGKWNLETLIDVSVDLGILPAPRAASIDQVLRDYRNFVHPKKELKSAHPCTEAEGYMAKGALDGVCNHFSP